MGESGEKLGKGVLEKLKIKTEAEVAVAEVVQNEASDLSLRTTAKVRAKFNAYLTVYENYEKFITNQVSELADGKYKDNPYKELGVARLIAAWLLEAEGFLLENESLMQNMKSGIRKRFVEESLDSFPENIRNDLLEKLNDKKQEILIWFADELRQARARITKQKKPE